MLAATPVPERCCLPHSPLCDPAPSGGHAQRRVATGGGAGHPAEAAAAAAARAAAAAAGRGRLCRLRAAPQVAAASNDLRPASTLHG